MRPLHTLTLAFCISATSLPAADPGINVRIAAATPATFTDVPYGEHVRQTMDVWQTRSGKPAPLVIYFHGGGWQTGDKKDIREHLDVRALLDAGIAVASVNYRLLQDANAAKIAPPVQWPMGDAARAVQFLRSKAGEWRFEKTRFAATGVSAGGCTSLWLAMHDDMAEPQSPDPVARESTRLFCVAAKAPVVSLDPKQLCEWIPNSIFSAHAFGFAGMTRAESFAPFLAARDSYLPQIQRYSPIEHASKDDPPVFMEFPTQDKPPVPGEAQTDPNHSAVSGLMLERKLQSLGVKVELRYKGDGKTGHANVQEYLMDVLKPIATAATPIRPKPALANVPYGTHERQVLDFYKAESAQPTPLLIFIHGGGWIAGDKKDLGGMTKCLAAGISVVSINYRYTWEAQLAGVKPPVEWPLHDAARALQFVRSKATEWNIDKQRIATSGGSAGGSSSLWLALHDDMADPKSSDPIARESTRLWCAAATGAQTSLDPRQLKEWTPNSTYGGHAFGFMNPTKLSSRDSQFAEFLAARESLLPWIKEYSPIELVTADDPPIYLLYNEPPALGQIEKDPTHTANYGVKLQEKLRAVGVECELVYPAVSAEVHEWTSDYLIRKLKEPATKKNAAK